MKSSRMLWAIWLAAATCCAGPLKDSLVGPEQQVDSRIRLAKRQLFNQGQPIDGKGQGAVISGGTNNQIDRDNPDNLGRQPTDGGFVPNLKWRFSDSRTRIFKGGWIREQVVTDLPASTDLSAAQLHLTKGSYRELHWHSVSEWAIVIAGQVRIFAVDEDGKNQIEDLQVGDIWYFPKGQAHGLQGRADENEFLLVFDTGDFDALGVSFQLSDWLVHTPRDILARNFGVNASLFDNLPTVDPFITDGTIVDTTVSDPNGVLQGNSSFVHRVSPADERKVPGGGGTLRIIDSRNFPVAQRIASAIVTLEPKGLRELHWHPNAQEWLFFQSGTARASVFTGTGTARTFDFSAGDTAVFPSNAGHYIENTSPTEKLVWFELYKSDRVADISLTQWLALVPPEVVAQVLNVSVDVVAGLKKEKQILLKGD